MRGLTAGERETLTNAWRFGDSFVLNHFVVRLINVRWLRCAVREVGKPCFWW